jgi:hypothetical protein
MAYAKVNVTKGQNTGAGTDIKGKAYIFDWNEVIGGYNREDNGIEMLSNLQFQAGAFIQTIEFTKSTLKNSSKSDGDDDAKGIIQGCEFNHPGSSQEIREFRSHWMNKDIGIVYEHCNSDMDDDLYGSPCAPLQMKFEATEDKDNNSTKFTFESTNKGPDVAIYKGTKNVGSPTVVAADTTDVDVSNGPGEYQLTDNTGATQLTSLANAENNGVYTLIGSGGNNPATIATGGNFILADGTAWTGIAGATITFRAFKDGAATWKFIEQSRS